MIDSYKALLHKTPINTRMITIFVKPENDDSCKFSVVEFWI